MSVIRDVDLVALRSGQELAPAQPLPAPLRRAAERVARDFDLGANWLNGDPTSLLDFGLPKGFLERLDTRSYGEALKVHFASRYDQIHFKLYAMVEKAAQASTSRTCGLSRRANRSCLRLRGGHRLTTHRTSIGRCCCGPFSTWG